MKLYAAIAHALSILDSNQDLRQEWRDMAEERLERIIDNALPHGSGFDVTPEISHNGNPLQRFTITGSYHKMDEHGGYDGWADFEIEVVAKQNLVDPWDLFVQVKDPDESLCDYIADTYAQALNQEFTP